MSVSILMRLGLLLILLTACGADGQTWRRVQESGELRVGLDPTYPPFETLDGQNLAGIDVDLARAVASDLGLEASFVYFGYDGLYDALATKQVDVLVSALVFIPERTRDFSYSQGYFDAGQVLLSRSADAVDDMSQLSGRSVAVELGAQGHVIATTWQRQLPNLKILTYNTPEEVVQAVSDEEARAAIFDNVSAQLYVRQYPTLQVSEVRLTEEPYSLVVRVEDALLLQALDGSLDRLQASGQLDGIIERWLGN